MVRSSFPANILRLQQHDATLSKGTVYAVPWPAIGTASSVCRAGRACWQRGLSSHSSYCCAAKLHGPPPRAHLHPEGMQKARVRKGTNKLDTPLNKGRWSGGKGGQRAAGARRAGWLSRQRQRYGRLVSHAASPGVPSQGGWGTPDRSRSRPQWSALSVSTSGQAPDHRPAAGQNHDEGGPRSPAGDHGPEGAPCRSSWFVGPPQPCRQRPG